MMKIIYSLVFLVSFTASAQLPSTSIFLADLVQKGNNYLITNVKDISGSPGYNNQPTYSADGNYIYFTSDRDGKQTDIYRFDVKKRSTDRITQTSESEYSPLIVPGMDAISVVRVNADSAQQLYRMLPDGSNPVILYTGSDTVGYYGWLDPNRVLIFALGEKNSLRLINLNDQKSYFIAENIGRNIQQIPGANAVSFTTKIDSTTWQLKKFDGILNKVESIINLPAGTEDYAWLNSSVLVSGSEGDLSYINVNKKETGWLSFADLTKTPVSNFYRIAIDPAGTKIAFVVKNQAAE